MQDINKGTFSSYRNDFTFLENVRVYLKSWVWFVISVALFTVLSTIYLRYQVPKFLSKASIKIVEDGSTTSGVDLFGDLGLFAGSANRIEDEIEVIASRSNIYEVCSALNLGTTIYEHGQIIDSEIYKEKPINVNIISEDTTSIAKSITYYIEIVNETDFVLKSEDDSATIPHSFGNLIETEVGNLIITPNAKHYQKYIGKELVVKITPLSIVADKLKSAIKLAPAEESSNIVNIQLKHSVKKKSEDIINTLIDVYNRNAQDDKEEIANKTSDFINDRIADIFTNLSSIDQTAEDFKTSRGVTDIASEANLNLNVGASNRQELTSAQTQLQIASSMKSLVSDQGGFEVLPSNLGLSDPSIANTTERYNQLVQERKRLLQSSNEKNPIVVNLDAQILDLRRGLLGSLNSLESNLTLEVNALSGQQAVINSKIYSAPGKERALRDITRKQQTTEQLYLYLLQKREEAQIAAASASPKSYVVDRAYTGSSPVSPKTRVIQLAAILIGLLIPFSIIYIRETLDDKVKNRDSLERILSNIPIIGEVPRVRSRSLLVNRDDRSTFGEALRIIRSNIDYLINTPIKSTHPKNNVVFVTSSISGEGKTTFSVNLSIITASTQDKVILIGADIRNPKFRQFFDKNDATNYHHKTKLGLSDYLFDDNLDYEHIINKIGVHGSNLDVIFSGRIPPNPADLLTNNLRFKDLLSTLSESYDYVIVDTAPIMLVSDTMLISNNADHTVYLTRSGVTELRMLNFPIKLQKEGKLNKLVFVVNDVKAANLGYAGKYGYGYNQSKKSWWKL